MKPTDLKADIMQSLLDNGKNRDWIMDKYNIKTLSAYYRLCSNFNIRQPKRPQKEIKRISGGPTTNEQKAEIDKLHDMGKAIAEIRDIMNLTYNQVYRRVNRELVPRCYFKSERFDAKPEQKTSIESKPVVVREMPPINPPGEVIKSAPGKEVVEAILTERFKSKDYGNKLEPIITPLDQRPRNTHVNGLVWDGSKWIPRQSLDNIGRAKHVGAGSQL